jgi:AraC-like DNA-binding protein
LKICAKILGIKEQDMPLKSKGILNPRLSAEKFNLRLYAPSQDLAYFIEHYWLIDWDLRGQEPFVSEVLSHPCVQLAFEREKTAVFGVVSSMYSHLLKGEGAVFGVKFRVGAFYPFVRFPISELTDKVLSLQELFGVDGKALSAEILSQKDDEDMICIVEKFLTPLLPEKDPIIEELNMIAELVAKDAEICKVEDLVARLPFSKRNLQRLFKQYVGVSPKWLIQRYRLHEAAEQIAKSGDWARLAVDLGYFDQAHFIKDFKAMIGKTPIEYAKSL